MHRMLPILVALAACETVSPEPAGPAEPAETAAAPVPTEPEVQPTSTRPLTGAPQPSPTDCGPEAFGREPPPSGAAKVVVRGTIPAVFIREGERFEAGTLPSGTYVMQADFGMGELWEREVEIQAGAELIVSCSTLRRDCRIEG